MTERCTVCDRNPERMNSDIAQCSHVDCPHRGLDIIYESDLRMVEREDRREHRQDSAQPRREPKCQTCGSTEVRWRQQTGKWVLFSLQPGVEHVCDPGDLL